MSTLLKALRRADQPQFTPHMPLMGLPVSQEEEPNRRRSGRRNRRRSAC